MAPAPPPRIEREMAVREVGGIRPSRNQQHRGGGAGFQQQPYGGAPPASRPPPQGVYHSQQHPAHHLHRSQHNSSSSFTPMTTTTSSSSYADLANEPPPVRRPPVSTTTTTSGASTTAAPSDGRAARGDPPPRNDSYYGAESSTHDTTATRGGGRTNSNELGRGGARGGRGPGRGGGRFLSNNNNKPPPSQLSQQYRNVPQQQQQQQAQQSADDSSFYSRHSNNSSSHATNPPKQCMLKEGRGSGRGGSGGGSTSGTTSREGRERGRRGRRGRGGGRYNGGGRGGGSSLYYEGSTSFRSDRSLDEADDSSFAKRRRLADSPLEHSPATATAAVAVSTRVRGTQSFGSEGEIMSDDNLDNEVTASGHATTATATPRDSGSNFPSDFSLGHLPLQKRSQSPNDSMGGASRMKRELSRDASPLSFRSSQHQGELSVEQPPPTALSSPTATGKILQRNSSDFRDMDRPPELGNSHNVRDVGSHIDSGSKYGPGGSALENRATDSQRNEVTAAPRFSINQRGGNEIGNTNNSYGPSSSGLVWNDNRNNEPPQPRFRPNEDDNYSSNNSFYGPGPRSDIRNEPASLTSARFNYTISHRRDDPTKSFEPIPEGRNNNRNDVREEHNSIYGPSSSPPSRSNDMRSCEPPSRPPNLDAPEWNEEKRRPFSMMDGFPPSSGREPRPNDAGPATTLPPPPPPPVMEIELNHYGHSNSMDRFPAPGRGGVGRGRGGRYSQDGSFGRGRGRHDSGGGRGGASRPVGDNNNTFVLRDDFGRAIPGRGDPFPPPHHHRDMPHHEFGSSGRGRGDNFGGRGRGRFSGGGGRGVDNFGGRGGGRGPMLDGGPPFDSRGPSPTRMSGAPPPWRLEPPLQQQQQPHSSFSRLAQQAPPPIRSPREISGGWNARPRSASPERPMLITKTEQHRKTPPPPPPPLSQTMTKKPVPTGTSAAAEDGAPSVAVAPPKSPPQSPAPSPLEPSGLVLALTRLADLEAQMEYEFTKLMKLGRQQQMLRLEYQVLEQLPVGKEAFEEDYNTKFAAELAGEPGEVV